MELQISMNIKDITIPLLMYFITEHSEHYTNLSTLNPVTSSFFRVSTGALA